MNPVIHTGHYKPVRQIRGFFHITSQRRIRRPRLPDLFHRLTAVTLRAVIGITRHSICCGAVRCPAAAADRTCQHNRRKQRRQHSLSRPHQTVFCSRNLLAHHTTILRSCLHLPFCFPHTIQIFISFSQPRKNACFSTFSER